MKRFLFCSLLLSALTSSGIDITEPGPGYLENYYEKATFKDLIERSRHFSGRGICLTGYIVREPGVTEGGWALGLAEHPPKDGTVYGDIPSIIMFDGMYVPEVKKYLLKKVRLCGIYYTAPENLDKQQLNFLIRLDKITIVE